MKPTLLILAAGIGSRYGGLKQLDKVGPNGETLMDYSVQYAMNCGYGKVIFVIRRTMEADFRKYILLRYASEIPVNYVFQELDSLPDAFLPDPKRQKPYGTAHAILVAKDIIHEPFTVINADDFYGYEAFRIMSDFLQCLPKTTPPTFAMVGYCLSKTLSRHGTVSRGVCSIDGESCLRSIVEYRKIGLTPDGIADSTNEQHPVFFRGDEPVSMNFWGFTPDFFYDLNDLFIKFLRRNGHNPAAEFPIPEVITHFLEHNTAKIKVLHSDAEWFGVTYKEDRPSVVEKLKTIGMPRNANTHTTP